MAEKDCEYCNISQQTSSSIFTVGRHVMTGLRISRHATVAPFREMLKRPKSDPITSERDLKPMVKQRKFSFGRLTAESELESILTVPTEKQLKDNHSISGDVCTMWEGPLWVLRLLKNSIPLTMPRDGLNYIADPSGRGKCAEVLTYMFPDRYRIQPRLSPPLQVSKVYRNWKKAFLGGQLYQPITIEELFKVAEGGNAKEFERICLTDVNQLLVADQRGRRAVHQATVRNRENILQVIAKYAGDLNVVDNQGNTPLHIAIMFDSFQALEFLLGCDEVKTDILNDKKQAVIHLATEMNKVKALEIMSRFRSKINIQQGGEHGRSALHLAAIYDQEECARILITEFGACPRQPCNNGYYPIHEAAKNASSKTMEVFLQWGEARGCPREEMISFYDSEGNVPLHSAVHGGDYKAVELCLKAGAKISTQQHDQSTPVHLACAQGAIEIVRLMFMVQPHLKQTCLLSCDAQKMTPLHCAAMFDHPEIVQYLISEGAEMNALDKENRSPLLLAASRGGWKTTLTLIRLKANILLKDVNQRNVLTLVVMNGGRIEDFSEEVVKAHSKADLMLLLNEKDSFGCSPLHYASKFGHVRSLESLIRLGASINLKNNKNESPLHFAARYGRYNTVKQLLDSEKGTFIINEGDGEGLTPLHIASKFGHTRVIQLLLNRGALLHRDHNGRNPLHLAAMTGYTQTMELLHSVHSHLLDQKDKEGNTALHLAAMENQPNSAGLLLSFNCKLTVNRLNLNAVDYAIQYKFPDVALTMVTHQRAAEVLALKSEKHPCVTLALIASMPKVFEAVQDNCIVKANCKKDSKSFYVKYNFSCLQCPRVYAQVDKKTGETLAVSKPIPLPALNAMVTHGRVELLAHQLSQKYLQMKWHAYGKYFHLTNLLFYIIFLSIITCFSLTDDSVFRDANKPTVSKAAKATTGSIIIAYVIFNTLRELMQIQLQRWNYLLDPSHLVSWLLYASATAMVLPIFMEDESVRWLSVPSAATTIFLSWFNLLLYLQRFDTVGIYVVMFLEILQTLLRVLSVFSILIIAFGLAFYILLHEESQLFFDSGGISFIRTFAMMLEVDFVDTFLRDKESTENSNIQRIPHSKLSFAMLILFMVLMSILLMNLLVGLAVGDIESVRRNAQLKRLAMQVVLHTELERKLPAFFLDRVDKMELIEYPNESKCKLGFLDVILRKWFCNPFSENGGNEMVLDAGEDFLLEELMKQKKKLRQISNALDTQHQFLRLIVQKMEIKTEADDVDEGTSSTQLVGASSTNSINKWTSPSVRKKLRSALSFSKSSAY